MSESSGEMEKTYEPKLIEGKWLERWLKEKVFHAEPSKDPDKNFSIVIPPPNVTGSLHMGHALNNTLQDILVRYQRMKGKKVAWIPGTDHAGIATQNVVERELAKGKKKRQDLGREKFIEEVWKWKEKHGDHIIHQLKRLGASCDWERERFTMDEGLSRAVREAFVRLYEKKLIERDLYLINWCPRCHTAISDIEVEHQEQSGSLWFIKYQDIVVATTRPETMLGDTAVAVHPDDERYQHLVGKKLLLPLVDREIPVISDHRVDREFGTGAVKVTPAHDFNDFAFGNDHKLPRINVFTPDGKMNENASHFQGLDRFECRRQIVVELEEKGFLVKTEPHKLSVGHCYRCKTVVEPYLSLQWFVRTKPLAERALQAVREGKTKFHPENWTKTYEQWMENIKDWCISRQIWWGHRVPAWYCRNCSSASLPSSALAATYNSSTSRLASSVRLASESISTAPSSKPIVSREAPEKCPDCGSTDLEQDSDVLDTWFSSGLWPFSTLGWPDQTADLKAFYPTSVLVTGFDIIFFWVARMMMMGLEFMGNVPFRDVYIHALVRDAQGQKMSKSKGNVIDPLTIMDKFGTDAFRFTLAALAAQGRDIKLSEDVIEGYRNFANKIWNASRFSLMNLEGEAPDGEQNFSSHDFWILIKLQNTIREVEGAIQNYEFDVAAKSVYQFFWHDFCDWYLELSKIHLNKAVLRDVLETSLLLLHPFMPFLTTEIWSKMGEDPREIESHFPEHDIVVPPAKEKLARAEADVLDLLISVITAIRSIRGENRISPALQIRAVVYVRSLEGRGHFESRKEIVQRLARLSDLQVIEKTPSSKGMAHIVVSEGLEVFVPLEGLIDFATERVRLEKEIAKLREDKTNREKRLSNENFVSRADPEVVEEERAKVQEAALKIVRLEESLVNLS